MSSFNDFSFFDMLSYFSTDNAQDYMDHLYEEMAEDIHTVNDSQAQASPHTDTSLRSKKNVPRPRSTASTTGKNSRWIQEKDLSKQQMSIKNIQNKIRALSDDFKKIQNGVINLTKAKPSELAKNEKVITAAQFLQAQKEVIKDLTGSISKLGEKILDESIEDLEANMHNLETALSQVKVKKNTYTKENQNLQKIALGRFQAIQSTIKETHNDKQLIEKELKFIAKPVKSANPKKSTESVRPTHKQINGSIHNVSKLMEHRFYEFRRMSETLTLSGQETSLHAKTVLQLRLQAFKAYLGLIKEYIEKAHHKLLEDDYPELRTFKDRIEKIESEFEFKAETIDKEEQSG